MANKSSRKPTRPKHFGKTNPKSSFDEVYSRLTRIPNLAYRTATGRPFVATAKKGLLGRPEVEPVIVFHNAGREKARSYRCCWNHITNCNRTYIDSYVQALGFP